MQQIYLDRDQCEQFEIAYFEKDSTCLRADVILASKFSGYDNKHTEFLQEFPMTNSGEFPWELQEDFPKETPGKSLRNSLRNIVRKSLRNSLRNSIGKSLGNSLRNSNRNSPGNS